MTSTHQTPDRPRPRARRPRLGPFLIATAGVALVTYARLPFEVWLAGRAPFSLYFLPILYVAWSGGMGATLVAVLFSLLAAKYFFVPVTHSFAIAPGEGGSLCLFLLTAAAMIALSRRASELRERAVRNEHACRRAERGARAAIWDWDADSRAFDTVALHGLFGLEQPRGRIAADQLESLVVPEDRDRFRDGLERARAGTEPVRIEFRIQHPTKGVRWLASVGEAGELDNRRVSGVTLDITDRVEAEERIAEQREWFEVTLRSIGDAVIASDREGLVTFMNRVAEDLTGWKTEDALRRPLSEVFRIINETTREEIENPADKVIRSGIVMGLANHTALLARDGRELPIADSAAPIHDKEGQIQGVILVFHDVTEDRRAADAVAEQREWFQKTLESIGDGVIASDVRGRVVFMNPVAEYLTGHRLEDARGRDCAEVFRIVDEDTRAPRESPVARVLREGTVAGLASRTLLVAGDGRERPIDDGSAPIRSRDGRIVGVVLVFRDISERRALENDKQHAAAERERLLESERLARADAERANRLKDEFVATLSHELRTPLNAILGWLRVLQTDPGDAGIQKQALEVIDRNTRMQAQLVSDLLDMSRILSGKMRLEVQSVDLGSIVEAAVASIRPAVDAKRIQLRQQVAPLPRAAVDPARLQQIVWNLLSNAVKFTPPGGHVQLTVERVGIDAEIAVRDDGIGIRPEFLALVFDRFRQVDGSTTRRYGGLGLGLSIVKQLVELHGGSVTAESPGEDLGATFRVRLPIGSAKATDPLQRSPGSDPDYDADCERIASISDVRLDRLAVLVVEDEPDTRELVVRLLQQCGANAVGVATAAAALERLQAAIPDLLICDIGLPSMDGYTLIQQLRQSPEPRLSRLPAIALTAFARPEDRSRALRSGFQAHLVKPAEPAELIALVASFAALSRTGDDDTRS